MAIIKLYLSVSSPSEILGTYDQVKIYRATSISGTYTEITTASTRIPIVEGKTLYTYRDTLGDATYWYKSSYYSSVTGQESAQSDPNVGSDAEEIDYIMSVQRLKDVYLFGVDLTNDSGDEYPDIMFEFAIRAAISWLEHELDVSVKPTTHTDERHDFDRLRYSQWMSLTTEHYPILDVSSVKLYWPSASEAIVFPSEWITAKNKWGQVNLVPSSGSLSQSLLTAGGAFLPWLLGGYDYLPNALSITYRSGFEAGSLPYDLRALIGMRSCFPILNTAGDLIAGAGIANFSLSMDGISQSIGTTSSATNSGYGARLIQFEKEIKGQLPVLRKFYKGVRVEVG